MGTAGYISVQEASALIGRHERRVREMIETEELRAIRNNHARGGNGGKTHLVEVGSMPVEAQLKRIAQNEDGKVGAADIMSYKAKYGDAGVKAVLDRRIAVLEAILYEQDGKGDITARKEALAARIGVTPRTLYRWQKAWEQDGLAGLMDKVEQSNKGKPRAMCLFAQDFTKAQLFGSTKRTNRSVYRKLCILADELGDTACDKCPHKDGTLARRELALQGHIDRYPLCDKEQTGRLVIPECPGSFDRFASSIPADQLAYARQGKRYWEANYMPKTQRNKPEKINECLFGDHHMFDIFVIDDDGAIVRPWMTAWSDAKSGCFPGWCITTNPNSDTIAETLARAIPEKDGSPFSGTPYAVYMDNGKDYRSLRFEGEHEVECVIGRLNEQFSQHSLLQALGVAVFHALPYKAWSKTIERLFGILEDCYIRELPGWCGNEPKVRPEDMTRSRLQKLAAQGQLLTLRQFERVMREQIMPAYHNERFENEQSPLEIYQAGEKARTDMVDWRVLSILKSEKVTRKISTMGVKLNNTFYWHNDLRHMVGEEVTVLYSRTDRLSVTIIKGNRAICEAPIKDKLKLIGEDPAKIGAHMRLQQQTRREVVEAISDAQRVIDVALRNTIYEPIDVKAVGCGTVTTAEYRKAAKAKAETRAELAEYVQRDKAKPDAVRNRFMELGDQVIAASKRTSDVKK